MEDKKNLHKWIAKVRGEEDINWHRNNPGVHPCEWYKYLALKVMSEIKNLGLEEVEVHPASVSGQPEYGYTISLLEEIGVKVKLMVI